MRAQVVQNRAISALVAEPPKGGARAAPPRQVERHRDIFADTAIKQADITELVDTAFEEANIDILFYNNTQLSCDDRLDLVGTIIDEYGCADTR